MALNAHPPGPAEALPSWTTTLNEPEAMLLLDLAHPGLALDAWRIAAHDALPQAAPLRRRVLVRLAQNLLLDHDGRAIVSSRFLQLFQAGGPRQRHDLVCGRAYLLNPWLVPAAQTLVLPRLAEAEQPLARRGADRLAPRQVADFVHARGAPGLSPSTRARTASAVLGALVDLGAVVRGATSRDDCTVRRATPDPLAFGWLVAWQLRAAGRTEATDDWAVHHSAAALGFAVAPDHGRYCLETAIRAGLFERSYLAGIPRVRLPAADEEAR